jgi:hypothetical protein
MSTILAAQVCEAPFDSLHLSAPANFIPGQLIPFIIGIASLPSAIWGAFENWQEVKEEESHEMKEVCLVVDTIIS